MLRKLNEITIDSISSVNQTGDVLSVTHLNWILRASERHSDVVISTNDVNTPTLRYRTNEHVPQLSIKCFDTRPRWSDVSMLVDNDWSQGHRGYVAQQTTLTDLSRIVDTATGLKRVKSCAQACTIYFVSIGLFTIGPLDLKYRPYIARITDSDQW